MYLSYGAYICVPRSQHVSAAIMAGPLFTKRTDLLPQDLVKSRNVGLDFYNRSES